MYVCLCNGLTDRDIRAAARTGGGSVDEVYRRLGSAPICCSCVETAQAIIDERETVDGDSAPSPVPAAALADAA